MDNSNLKHMTDLEYMNLAKKRVRAKNRFKWHCKLYILINAILIIIYFLVSRSYFWPVWSLLGWGLVVAFDGIAVAFILSDASLSDKVSDEYNRLKRFASVNENGCNKCE
jgi:hypothetical protein